MAYQLRPADRTAAFDGYHGRATIAHKGGHSASYLALATNLVWRSNRSFVALGSKSLRTDSEQAKLYSEISSEKASFRIDIASV